MSILFNVIYKVKVTSIKMPGNPLKIQWLGRKCSHCWGQGSFPGQGTKIPRAVQLSSVTQSCRTLFDPMDCSTPGFPVHHQHLELFKLMSIELVMPSGHLILCCPLLLLPSIFLSIRVFSNEAVLGIRWPKCWSFSFSISPSSEYSGLISFRMDWLDLLAVQGALKGFLQHHSSKASIVWHLAFFMVQLSHPYMATGKTIALTRRRLLAK